MLNQSFERMLLKNEIDEIIGQINMLIKPPPLSSQNKRRRRASYMDISIVYSSEKEFQNF